MQVKLILSHILIFVISIFGFTGLYEYIVMNDVFGLIYSIFHLTVIVVLYIISGYLSSMKLHAFSIWNYYIVALIGVIIWSLAIINSPIDLDWKKGNGGVLWLIYRLYISGIETPFNFNESFSIHQKDVKVERLLLLVLTIVPSFLQACGGFFKVSYNKKGVVYRFFPLKK